jgi:hypothetical protein
MGKEEQGRVSLQDVRVVVDVLPSEYAEECVEARLDHGQTSVDNPSAGPCAFVRNPLTKVKPCPFFPLSA